LEKDFKMSLKNTEGVKKNKKQGIEDLVFDKKLK
jgi:hypothetical protein